MIGVFVDGLLAPYMNKIFRLSKQTPVTIFTNNIAPIDVYDKTPILTAQYIWNFPYPIIATDIFSAIYLERCPISKRRFFYIQAIDWTTNGLSATDVIKCKNLELLCCPELKDALNGTWGEIETLQDWNYNAIQRLLDRRPD